MSVLREVIASAPWLRPHAVGDPGPGRFADREADPARLFVLEAVHQGYLLHYGDGSAFHALDDDLRLLGGDALYALGLARIAERGDLEAVAELADLISLAAQANFEGRPELAEELWEASATALSREGGEGARAALAERLPRLK